MKKETLRQKRCRFSSHFAQLVLKARQLGFEAAIDQVKRHQKIAKEYQKQGIGISNSLHLLALAGDLILYKNGKYLRKTEDYRQLGEWWESLGSDFRWGGRFNDGNHFSIEHNGVK